MWRRSLVGLALMVVLATLLAACGQPQVEIVEVIVTATPGAGDDSGDSTASEDDPAGENTTQGRGLLEEPHPILSDQRVRQAIAYCADREELIESVYPFLEEEQRQQMLMDTFIPQGHWAHTSEGVQQYPFDPEQGRALLEEAGWFVGEWDDEARVNEAGESLALKYTTTDAQFRVTFSTVLERQLMENCNIQIVRTHAPASWWFGNTTGSTVRDFELGVYAWVGQADPAGDTLYACNQIPMPDNNWEGQNYMGWCNETASDAIIAANSVLDREERKKYYAIVQQEFSKDMVSLPLFSRFEAYASSNGLQNFQPDVSEASYVVNVHEWELDDGGDTVIIGLSQEPSTMFMLVDDASVTQLVHDLVTERVATGRGYDYQPVAVPELPTVENGGATLAEVEVGEGDMVWTTSGEVAELAPGVEVRDATNEAATFEGDPITMHQLTVNFEIVEGLTWEDGVPVTQADLELAQKINCDPESGALSLLQCDRQERVEVTSDTTMTITYRPGAKPPEYMVYTPGALGGTSFTVGAYPAHRVLEDGRLLADVPAAEWSELPEVAQQPLSYGPYRLLEWDKGQRMVFEANPHYYLGEPNIKNLIIQFFGDTNAAVAALLNGDVDVIGSETLGAGAELETVINAGESGDVQVYPFASATWEVMDMNLFVK